MPLNFYHFWLLPLLLSLLSNVLEVHIIHYPNVQYLWEALKVVRNFIMGTGRYVRPPCLYIIIYSWFCKNLTCGIWCIVSPYPSSFILPFHDKLFFLCLKKILVHKGRILFWFLVITLLGFEHGGVVLHNGVMSDD